MVSWIVSGDDCASKHPSVVPQCDVLSSHTIQSTIEEQRVPEDLSFRHQRVVEGLEVELHVAD